LRTYFFCIASNRKGNVRQVPAVSQRPWRQSQNQTIRKHVIHTSKKDALEGAWILACRASIFTIKCA
jgi:hypothetical protein